MVGWMRAEGGHYHNDAKYNPLNTTQPEPGAGNTGTQGNIKVYRSWNQGIDATVKTLRNGNYGGIINALRSGNPGAVANAIDRSPWGTHGPLVRNAIMGTKAPASVRTPNLGGGSSSARGGGGAGRPSSTRTITETTPGVDNSAERRSLVLQFLGDKNSDVLDFAMQAKQLQDIAPTSTTRTEKVPGSGGGGDSAAVSGSGGLARMAAERADIIDRQRLPYSWGGGHGGKTPINKAVPLDCSGAVSKVLGIDPRVSGAFGKWGRPGDGGSKGVTIYSNGHHVLMKINGHFFGTSHANPGGGAGWIPQSAISPGYLKGFTARHSAR